MNKGFSLVELIVVIAIMAILVGVAVPVYTQYISNAEAGVEEQYLDELKRAINTAKIDLQSGLTDKTAWTESTNKNIPVYINIDSTEIVALDEDGHSCVAFLDLLDDIITIDQSVEYTEGEEPTASAGDEG